VGLSYDNNVLLSGCAMTMNSNENRNKVLENDKAIERQVPGILNDNLGVQKPVALRNEELFYRATDYRGS